MAMTYYIRHQYSQLSCGANRTSQSPCQRPLQVRVAMIYEYCQGIDCKQHTFCIWHADPTYTSTLHTPSPISSKDLDTHAYQVIDGFLESWSPSQANSNTCHSVWGGTFSPTERIVRMYAC